MMGDNGDLASKLRAEDAEQFYTLVRMHLSFVLDLNGEEWVPIYETMQNLNIFCNSCEVSAEKKGRQLKWNMPFLKKAKGALKPSEQLTKSVVDQMNVLIEFLRKPESKNKGKNELKVKHDFS